MSKRMTKAPRTVASGDGWRIEFDPQTRDYAAFDACGLLGFTKTETAARTLITNYRTRR